MQLTVRDFIERLGIDSFRGTFKDGVTIVTVDALGPLDDKAELVDQLIQRAIEIGFVLGSSTWVEPELIHTTLELKLAAGPHSSTVRLVIRTGPKAEA